MEVTSSTTDAPRAGWPPGLHPDSVDQVLVVLSDIEMGAGGSVDDFPQSDWLAELIKTYAAPPFAGRPVTLVLNGDTFDFLKTSYLDRYPTHIDREVALGKLTRIAAAHPRFFEGVRSFLSHSQAERQVCFITGNHDPELSMPEVQAALRALCAPPRESSVIFAGFSHRVGDVHIEHGCQKDPLFAFEAETPLIEHQGRPILNLPWGSVALLEVAIPLSPLLCQHDRIKPRDELLGLVPELKHLLVGAYWRYWTRDFWQKYFSESDPLRHLSWTILKEVAYRFATGAMDVSIDNAYEQMLRKMPDVRVCLVGHQHEPAWWSSADRRLLRTGCVRNEYALEDQGERLELLPNVYAEVYLRGERSVLSRLVEVHAPLPENIPRMDSLSDVIPLLRDKLASAELLEQPDQDRSARDQQEASEAMARADPELWSRRFDFLRSLRRALSREPASSNNGAR